jgi:prepilin-type N-terminal cleavage/methylation domain-containing protein
MNKTCSGGYTLIEILTVVVIMALIFGVSYPNFRGYQQRQQALSYGRELESHLFEAQQLALSGTKPDKPPCNVPPQKTFKGIRVAVLDTQNYEILAMCDNSPVSIGKTYTLPSTAVIKSSSPPKFTFNALGQGTDITAGSTFDMGVCVGNQGYGVSVNKSGQITKNESFTCP